MGGSFPQNDICLIQLQSPHSTSYPNYDVFTTNVRGGANAYIAGYGENTPAEQTPLTPACTSTAQTPLAPAEQTTTLSFAAVQAKALRKKRLLLRFRRAALRLSERSVDGPRCDVAGRFNVQPERERVLGQHGA